MLKYTVWLAEVLPLNVSMLHNFNDFCFQETKQQYLFEGLSVEAQVYIKM